MTDPRLASLAADAGVSPEAVECPVIACSSGPGANVYLALLRGPDGSQKAVWGCLKHLPVLVGQGLNGIRLEPFE